MANKMPECLGGTDAKPYQTENKKAQTVTKAKRSGEISDEQHLKLRK